MLSATFEGRYRKTAIESLNPARGEELLEIGFGPGDNLILLAEAVGPKGHVTGIDISKKMCEQAERKINRRNLSAIVSIQKDNALIFNYKPQIYDGVLLSFTLETFSDDEISALLNLLAKSLKNNGRLTVLSMAVDEEEKQTLMYKMYLLSHKRFPHLVDCRPLNLRRIIEKDGFEVYSERTYRYYGLPITVISATPGSHSSII